MNRCRPSGKDDPFGIHLPDTFKRCGIRKYFAIHVRFPNPAGYQLIVLASEIQDEDKIMIQSGDHLSSVC
jgi:hypothetical protein